MRRSKQITCDGPAEPCTRDEIWCGIRLLMKRFRIVSALLGTCRATDAMIFPVQAALAQDKSAEPTAVLQLSKWIAPYLRRAILFSRILLLLIIDTRTGFILLLPIDSDRDVSNCIQDWIGSLASEAAKT